MKKTVGLILKQILCLSLVFTLSAPAANSAYAPVIERFPTSNKLTLDVIGDLSEDLLSAADSSIGLNKIPDGWVAPFDRRHALNDPQDRISDDFKIPQLLKKRVGFWFDIYTKYSEDQHVIHHARYPWIVFDVVDTADINSNMKLHKWTRYHRAKAKVKKEYSFIKSRLLSLSKRRSYKNLSKADRKLYNALIGLKGSRRSVFRKAYEHVRSQLGQKDFILSGLHYSPRYLPYMEEIFKSKGLPTELTRIPFVESSFNPHAESKVGASGLWQIMPKVGKHYFKVTDNIDERNSPLKATLAAAELMKSNFKQLKQWPLAVTAYNHGAYGVKKSLKKAKAKNLIQLISWYRGGAFKFASSNFYASFLAVLHAEKYHREIFRNEIKDQENLLRYSVYSTAKPLRAKELIKLVGVDKDTFVEYNLDLKDAVKKNIRIPRNHRFLVPFERQLDLEAKHHLGIRPVRAAALSKIKAGSS